MTKKQQPDTLASPVPWIESMPENPSHERITRAAEGKRSVAEAAASLGVPVAEFRKVAGIEE